LKQILISDGDYPMNENIGSQMDRAGEVPADKSNDLHLGSDSENVNKSGAGMCFNHYNFPFCFLYRHYSFLSLLLC
jgi:hypothetical protein